MKALPRLLLFTAAACSMSIGIVAQQQGDPKAFLATKAVDFSNARSLPYESGSRTLFENVLVGGLHYAMIVDWKKGKLEPSELHLLTTVQIPFRGITVDGVDEDWAGIPAATLDPANDKDATYAAQPGTDLAAVYLARGSGNIYFRMTFHDAGPSENTMYIVEFQQYLTQLHTPGDLFVIATKSGGGWNVVVHERRAGGDPVKAEGGPAANGAGFVEWAVPISALQFQPNVPSPYFPPAPLGAQGIENRYVRAYIHPNPVPGQTGPVADSNESLARPLVINFYQ